MANLTFKSTNATTVALNKIGSPDTLSLKYKLNDGLWTDYTEGSSIALSNNDLVQFSGLAKFSKNIQNRYNFATSGEGTLEVSGLLISLVSSTTIEDKYEFNSLFSGCANITTISGLVFPSGVTSFCYANMFKGCTGLTNGAATLSASTLARWCYANMFAGCTNLTAIPDIKADSIEDYSFFSMFYGCKELTEASLINVKALNKTFAANGMFRNCYSLSSLTVGFNTWTNVANECKNWLYNTEGGTLSSMGIVEVPEDIIPSTWEVYQATDLKTIPLTFIATSNNQAVQLNQNGNPEQLQLYTKKNNGDWTAYSVGTRIDLASGDTVAFSGITYGFSSEETDYYQFATTGNLITSGNIMSLIGMETYNSGLVVPYAAFVNLFKNTSIVRAPLLPATYVVQKSYKSMFRGCNSLTASPLLPATGLTDLNLCYHSMFRDCTGLVSAGAISARVVDNCGYGMYAMFSGCTSLVEMPNMNPISGLGDNCCRGMFYKCTSLTGAEKLQFAGNPVWNSCCEAMFAECSSLIALPLKLYSCNSSSNNSFKEMFRGCTSLTNVPSGFLPAEITSLGTSSCEGLFRGCYNLVNVAQDAIQTTSIANSCYQYMFYDCSSLTSAPDLPATSISNAAYQMMFRNCTSLATGPSISATYIPASGLQETFRGCPNLSSVRVAFTSWSTATNATSNWMSGVANDGTFYCPTGLDTSAANNNRRASRCPVNWTVVNI